MRSNLLKRVVLTLAYTDQFSFPLSSTEIWLRLIALDAKETQLQGPVSQAEVEDAVFELQRAGTVAFIGDWFFLKGSDVHIQTRQRREKFSEQKWEEVYRLLEKLRLIPWVQGVAVTGSLAMNNATADDDVDFLIVTSANSMWLVRVITTWLAWLYGKRRSWKKEEKNSWCFNLWLERSDVVLAPARRSMYSAYEVCQAKWVLQRGALVDEFFTLNNWVHSYLPVLYSQAYLQENLDVANPRRLRLRSNNWLVVLLWPLTVVVNAIAYALQAWYMQPHRTREEVVHSRAFFHPRDTKAIVYERWKKSLEAVYS